MKRTTYVLKYCERCGALGVRRNDSAESYCGPCGQILVNYSPARDNRQHTRRLSTQAASPTMLPRQGKDAAALPARGTR